LRAAEKDHMAQKMLIDATHPEETRVVVVEGSKVEEFDFESINKRQIAGNIYLAKVTRVEPSLQAAFVDYGGNRHGFLAFAEIHPDYYQIPVADRERLLAEQAADRDEDEPEEEEDRPLVRKRRRGRRGRRPEGGAQDAGETGAEVRAGEGEPAALGETDRASTPADAPAEGAASAMAAPLAERAADPATVSEPAPAEPEEPETDGEDAGEEEIESVGAEDVQDEIAPRRAPLRRYKIQEVIKVRQILLVQVVKEERGNKGAALTTYLSLPGRYCVLMPNTARGGGISRKITSAADRKKLKEIAAELDVPRGAGLIIRTAGSERSKAEIKRDYEYLIRQWDEIRDLTLRSIAPALIYEEGSLIKRAIRDYYHSGIEEVLVEGEAGHRDARDYMKMLIPGQERVVKSYTDPIPLFSRYQVESYLASMFSPVVQLKSGGYIVIGITEALVAIDVNSGRATREHSIEETALKTNLEAADEISRQLRLRDLAGLIVIDFIDMEDRRNNAAVEKRLKDRLKSDRARIQVGRISAFGLLEMSRQRLRPGMLEATTQPCPHCHGTGLIRSGESLALTILREIEEEGVRQRSREVLVAAPISVANYLINQKREAILRIESRYGMSVRIEADPALLPPNYRIDRFKTATRVAGLGTVTGPITVDSVAPPEEAEAAAAPDAASESPRPADAQGEAGQGGRKRRRRRRRRGGDARAGEPGGAQVGADFGAEGEGEGEETAEPGEATDAAPARPAPAPEAGGEPAAAEVPDAIPHAPPVPAEAAAPAAVADVPAPEAAPAASEAPAEPAVRRRRRAERKGPSDALAVIGAAEPTPEAAGPGPLGEVTAAADIVEVPEGRAGPPARRPRARKRPAATEATADAAMATPEPEPVPVAAAEAPADGPGAPEAPGEAPPPAADAPEPAPASAPTPTQPRRRGWWSVGR
jgi:ribonuclease E